MMQNILKLNPKKTEVIVVKSKNNFDNDSCVIPSIKLSDKETISCSKVVKSLGVYFDEYLTFNHQISSVVQSCNITLRNLWTIAGKLSFELKRQLVHCLLFSKLDYCNGLYYGLPDIQLKRLQKLQNWCVRFLNGKRVKPWDSIRPFLKQAHFLPIKERVQFKIALMVFKSINNIYQLLSPARAWLAKITSRQTSCGCGDILLLRDSWIYLYDMKITSSY